MKAKKILLLPLALLASTCLLYSESLKDALLDALSRDSSSHYQAPSNYSNSGSYSPYAPPPPDADPRARNQHAFDVGYRVGQDDFHQHLKAQISRHENLYDRGTADAFGSGYHTGYDRAKSDAARVNHHQRPQVNSGHTKSGNYPSGYYPYSPTPKDANPQQKSRHAYEVGYRVGQDDFHHGHSKHYTKHAELYDRDSKHDFAQGYEHGYDKARAHTRSNQSPEAGAIRASVGQGKVTISQGNKVISTIRTASPNIERHFFTRGNKQIVIKSRGNHGPATVELFDVQTGSLRDKVLAFAIRNGQPEWAAGLQD